MISFIKRKEYFHEVPLKSVGCLLNEYGGDWLRKEDSGDWLKKKLSD